MARSALSFANFTSWFKEQFGSKPVCASLDEVEAAEYRAQRLRYQYEENKAWNIKHDAALKAVVAAPSILSLQKGKAK
jgi:hypothetical protein